MTAPTQPKDAALIRTWPNQWTQVNHPPNYPDLVKELKAVAKKMDSKSIETLRKDS